MITLTSRAHGPDISKYDLKFDRSLIENQLDFVIQRVSYRKTRDEAFDTLYPGVAETPIRIGYHYLNSDTPWKDQADVFLNIISGKGYQAVACDFEESFNTMSVSFANDAFQWIKYVAQHTGLPTLLYTSPNMYNQYITPSKIRYGINWDVVDYWQAQWFNTPNPNGSPVMPTGRTGGWKLWQYTAKADGTRYGLGRSTACDLNVFNGTVDDMRAWLKLDVAPTPTTHYTLKVDGFKIAEGDLESENG